MTTAGRLPPSTSRSRHTGSTRTRFCSSFRVAFQYPELRGRTPKLGSPKPLLAVPSGAGLISREICPSCATLDSFGVHEPRRRDGLQPGDRRRRGCEMELCETPPGLLYGELQGGSHIPPPTPRDHRHRRCSCLHFAHFSGMRYHPSRSALVAGILSHLDRATTRMLGMPR